MVIPCSLALQSQLVAAALRGQTLKRFFFYMWWNFASEAFEVGLAFGVVVSPWNLLV